MTALDFFPYVAIAFLVLIAVAACVPAIYRDRPED